MLRIVAGSVIPGLKINTLSHCLSTLSIKPVIPRDVLKKSEVSSVRKSSTSFFNKLPAENIWKGVTSVSNAGRKRGRGTGARKKIAKDLNRGQVIGVGKVNMLWPGLNSPVIRGKELVTRQQLPPDPEREQKLVKIRSEMGVFRPLKLSPIERGWSGAKVPGRSLGPPDPVGEDNFEGFDSRVLEYKSVFNMTGNLGRKRKISSFVVVGNGKGLAGFAIGKAVDGRASMAMAKNRAGQKLMYLERYDEHTVMHNFFTQFGKTKIFVQKKPKGYGLHCHRAIKTVCQVIGIKDLHAKIEGPTNLQHIVKGFILGLLNQKSHEQLAEEVGLHLVELKKENYDCPTVLASPQVLREDYRESPDFNQYVLDNRVMLERKKWPPFYAEYKGYKKHLYIKEKCRTHEKIRLQLLAEYGQTHSFLTPKHPECDIMHEWRKKEAKKAEEEAGSQE